jgi:hypothetical protein
MHLFVTHLTAFFASQFARGGRRVADERGDVPGWVLVTVMTAGLVAGLWAVAGPELERMLREALQSVS